MANKMKKIKSKIQKKRITKPKLTKEFEKKDYTWIVLILIAFLIFFASYFFADLHQQDVDMRNEWAIHIKRGDLYLGNGQWFPNVTVEVVTPVYGQSTLKELNTCNCDCSSQLG